MLCLSRYVNEVICIGDDIEIMILDVRGPKVRVGINAPAGVVIDRKEVREKPDYQKRTRTEAPVSEPIQDKSP